MACCEKQRSSFLRTICFAVHPRKVVLICANAPNDLLCVLICALLRTICFAVLCVLCTLARRTYSSERPPDFPRCGCFASLKTAAKVQLNFQLSKFFGGKSAFLAKSTHFTVKSTHPPAIFRRKQVRKGGYRPSAWGGEKGTVERWFWCKKCGFWTKKCIKRCFLGEKVWICQKNVVPLQAK